MSDVPSKPSKFPNGCSYTGKRHAHDQLSEVMAGANEHTSNADAEATKESDITLSEKVLKISSIWASSSDGENVGRRKPCRASRKTEIFLDETKRASSEVENDL
jgi:hypothetical protein